MFISTRDGYLNTNSIVRIIRNDGDDIAILRNGERVHIGSDFTFTTIIPADHGDRRGFQLIEVWLPPDVEEPSITLCPVIAWRIDHRGEAEPVTPLGVLISDHNGVLLPDGRIATDGNNDVYDFASDWFETLAQGDKDVLAALNAIIPAQP